MLSSSGDELALQLPLSDVGNFPPVLERLENDVLRTNARSKGESIADTDVGTNDKAALPPLGVLGFGLSVTSLEEVFLRLNEQDLRREARESNDDADSEKDDKAIDLDLEEGGGGKTSGTGTAAGSGQGDGAGEADEAEAPKSPTTKAKDRALGVDARVDDVSSVKRETKAGEKDDTEAVNIWNVQPEQRSWARQWRTMIYKRWINFKRDIKGIVFSVLLPVVFVALIMLTLTADISPVGPRIDLAVELFSVNVFSQENSFDIYNQFNTEDSALEWVLDRENGQWPDTATVTTWDAVNSGLDDSEWLYGVDDSQWNSYNLSLDLLSQYNSHVQGRYSAYVWNDTTLEVSIPTALLTGDLEDIIELLQALAPLLNSTLGNADDSDSDGVGLSLETFDVAQVCNNRIFCCQIASALMLSL